MRLLLECFACDPTTGSESFNAWRWGYGLAAAGYEVDLVTTEVGERAIQSEIQRLQITNIQLHVIPRNSRLLGLKFGLYVDYAQWLNRAAEFSKSLNRVDIAHHVSWGNVAFGTRIWRLGVPTLLGPCGGGQVMPRALMDHLELERGFERFRSTLVTVANRVPVLPGARLDRCHVLASNDETFDFAQRRGALSVQLFPDPMLDERDIVDQYPVRAKGSRVKVLWVGRMLPRKGIELAIKAFAESNVDADLVVVGDGPRLERAKVLSDFLGIGSKVSFLGRLPREAVGDLMRSCDIFLFASLRDSMPAQLLEAMAAGLPIVCLEAYGNKILVPEGAGVKVPVRTREQVVFDLAEGLRGLVVSPERREECGRGAFNESRRHLWPRKVAAMTAIYRKMCE
jgi:glycosyltransferase involved in cell wall biosynthesis